MLRMLPVFLLGLMSLLLSSSECSAQAVPDTMLNRVIPDSLPQKRAEELSNRNVRVSSAAPVAGSQGPLDSTALIRIHNPKKAAFYSAILPGAGQLYNRQYWKIPAIYAGMAVCGYFLIDNSTNYNNYRRAYINRGNPLAEVEYPLLTLNDLATRRDTYKRWLDMTVLLTAVGYTLQVLDALTFAHLKEFDVSKDISLQMSPVIAPGGAGFGLVMRWNGAAARPRPAF